MTLWGIDLGGTKIEGAIIDPTQPEVALHRLRLPTEAARGYDAIVTQIERVVSQLEQVSGQSRPKIIGIGTPGATEPSTGLIKNSNTTCLNGRALRADLVARLQTNVHLANDANCCALAEATLGSARGRAVVMGLILGTGVGGGIVVNGHLVEGCHGIAGEWGHNPVRGETTPCYCGRVGCVETAISGPGLERFYRENGGDALRLPEIATRARAGEPLARATLARLRDKFGEAIAAVINILDPDAIVIGGGVGNLDLLYEEETRAAIMRHLFNPELRTELLRPALGDSAGVFGAAMLGA
ncbi:MAG: ROK family protein [Verrucomicrobia bacterium]|nr:ROK family protein [Verrucomicrobiota bacterium]